ncbi:MAG: L-fucose/L-arabinose isomerase family protein [Anaerolineae bacterium]|nr:L-fucose/L-arabinose isomerase family protein [Anaerolineae bacterium]
MKQNITLGLVVGNRGSFPSHVCESGRATMLRVLEEEHIRVIALNGSDTKYGSVESLSDARQCADLFRAHRDEVDGVLVTLPNFGDERAVANTLRFANLNVPVLIHAFPDTAGKMGFTERRDSFCGKLSVCNNLYQYGIPFSVTRRHTVDPTKDSFRRDLREFAAVCRVVEGMRHARFGMLGARTIAFNTVRFSEKLLENAGIAVETLDLSEAFGRIAALADTDTRVQNKVSAVRSYANAAKVPEPATLKIAKLGVVIDEWMHTNKYDGTAIQCWTSIEEYFGVFPCTIMSMLSDSLMPSACETDIVGTASMYALALASGKPSAIVDWNNNYEDDPDKGIVFHCSNLPRSVFVDEIATIASHPGIADSFGKDNSWGILHGRMKANPFTYLRLRTDDCKGRINAYVGEGTFTNDPVDTYGGYGVVQVPNFQNLLMYICKNGFEHHVAVNMTQVGNVIHEAFTTYLGWDVYYHKG